MIIEEHISSTIRFEKATEKLQDCGDPFQTIRADVAPLGWVSVAGVLPKYFSSEWSFAQFRIPEDSRAMVAFGPQKHTVLIACANGR
jgi:hypothetical protein